MVRGSGFPETGRSVGLPVAAAGLFVSRSPMRPTSWSPPARILAGVLLAGFVLLAGLAFSRPACSRSAGGQAAVRGGDAAVARRRCAVALSRAATGTPGRSCSTCCSPALALGVIYAGYLSDEAWLVNLGVVFVAIDLVARYFDVFWSALPRSLGLIGAGLLVLGIAYVLERQRKRLLERMAAT